MQGTPGPQHPQGQGAAISSAITRQQSRIHSTRDATIPMLSSMFVVTDADAAAIRAVFEQRGEFAAAVELRRRFPGITDNALARECARTIAGWKPRPLVPHHRTRGQDQRSAPQSRSSRRSRSKPPAQHAATA